MAVTQGGMGKDAVLTTVMCLGIPVKVRMSRNDAEIIRAGQRAWEKRKQGVTEEAIRAVRRAARDRNSAKGAIKRIRDYSSMHDSGTRLGSLLPLLETAPSYVSWPAFLSEWPACDDTWGYTAALADALIQQPDSAVAYYDEDQRAAWERLPDSVRVYRGSSRNRAAGISWTTSKDVAEGFARGHRGIVVPDPIIATAQVDKRGLLAIFVERKESEVLIDPRRTEISLRRWRPR